MKQRIFIYEVILHVRHMMVQSEGESLGRRPIILGPDVLYIIEDVQSTRLLYGVHAFLIKEHANSFL